MGDFIAVNNILLLYLLIDNLKKLIYERLIFWAAYSRTTAKVVMEAVVNFQ